jgi:hypothetical protein
MRVRTQTRVYAQRTYDARDVTFAVGAASFEWDGKGD